MSTINKLQELGFSRYEMSCYLALLASHPANGSQISKQAGIARSRIYDVLAKMARNGLVLEVETGLYVPLPADELVRRLRARFEANLAELEKQLAAVASDTAYEYIWSLKGYETVMARAAGIIAAARTELYVRLFPESARRLAVDLAAAGERGVGVRFIAMGVVPPMFDIQVVHPDTERLRETLGGRSFDIIADRAEALTGIFETGNEEGSAITWSRNRWFVIAARDSLRHDFYHYFLDTLHERGRPLNAAERRIYAFIKADD